MWIGLCGQPSTQLPSIPQRRPFTPLWRLEGTIQQTQVCWGAYILHLSYAPTRRCSHIKESTTVVTSAGLSAGLCGQIGG